MRQRVVRVAVTAVLVALVLLAIPLALAVRATLYADQRDSSNGPPWPPPYA